MLRRYLEECHEEYSLPTYVERYLDIDDTGLWAALRASANPWARRIVDSEPYRLLVERHGAAKRVQLEDPAAALRAAGIDCIVTRSKGVLSKYVGKTQRAATPTIFVVDSSRGPLDAPPRSLEQATDLFQRYGEARQIARIYVSPEQRKEALEVLASMHWDRR